MSDNDGEGVLDLLVDRLSMPTSVSDADAAASMLEQLARLLETSAAYVIMLDQGPDGEVSIESRHAWYDFDVPPLEITAQRIRDLDPLYRRGPLVIGDSHQLPPAARAMREALESRRGLRAALMQPVYFEDTLRGFVGFNDRTPRQWNDAELALAKQLARLVVGTLDKRKADRHLAEAEAWIRSFVSETPIPVYCWEFAEPIAIDLPVERQLDAISAGVLMECNDAFATTYGLGTVEAAIGTRLADVPMFAGDRVRANLRRFIDQGYRSIERTVETTLRDGRRQVVVLNTTGFVEDGRLYRIWGNVRDVTAMVEAEREVEAGRARVDLAVQAGGLGFFDWRPSDESGSFDFAGGLGGRLPRSVTVQGFAELGALLGADNAARLIAAWEGGGQGAAERRAAEIELSVGGVTHHLLFQGSHLAGEGENAGHIVGVIQDLTAVRRAEAEQRRREEHMREAQKLESLGLLAGGIAHDFNNLLFGIRGFADLARKDMPSGVPGEGFLDEIESAAGVASELCRQMLAYSGRGSFELESIQVEALISGIRGLLESTIKGATALRFEFEAAPPIVADVSQVQQIVLNLVINAAEAIGESGGTIVVSSGVASCTGAELATPHIEHQLNDGEYTYIEVADDGSGMSGDTRARLFDPFFTTKFTGRGLGMSAVLGIVRAHLGSIKVSSEEGRGTRVRVLFPAGGGAMSPPRPDSTVEPSPIAGMTVLLVDDDERVRTVAHTMLERLDVTVLAAAGGAEAIRLFAARDDEISAVVLDLTMPEPDGVETARELRRLRSGVRIVLTSGYTEHDATRQLVCGGPTAFLQKPFSADDLRRALGSVMAW